jgi:RND family efflux transporter MFP subunit
MFSAPFFRRLPRIIPAFLAFKLGAFAASVPAAPVEAVLLPARSVVLSLPVEAILREVRVQEGQAVKKGDQLAILYSATEVLDRDRARKREEMAAYQVRAGEKLFATSSISEEAVKQKRLDADLATIELARAEAVLADKTLFAPFDGLVLRIHRDEGESVARIEKILQLVDISTLHAEAYLEADRLGQIRPGGRARLVAPLLGDRALDAVVDLVDPVVDPGSGLFRVRLTVPNPDLAVPSGIPVKVEFLP